MPGDVEGDDLPAVATELGGVLDASAHVHVELSVSRDRHLAVLSDVHTPTQRVSGLFAVDGHDVLVTALGRRAVTDRVGGSRSPVIKRCVAATGQP